MFSYSSATIDTFKNMFNSANKAPLLVDSDSILNVITSVEKKDIMNEIIISPNPATDKNVWIRFNNINEISLVRILNSEGKLIKQFTPPSNSNNVPVKLPEEKGVYIFEIYSDTFRVSKKVINQ